MDEQLLTDAQEIAEKRGSGQWLPDQAGTRDALVGFAIALGEDAAMIERLAAEVARLSREVDELKRR